MNETEMGKDIDEFELDDYVEHDKKYFFVHSAQIRCKLCSFKGKSIVQHYRTSHPESEVLISRINPHITKILIEDSIRNHDEYDKDHLKLEKMTCNFKCPFCLMVIKDTTNAYYNHISSHTGEYSFHCNHCSYWTHNQTNIHSHLKQIHYKIQKSKYKMVYLDPKISKYVFGYICSECYSIQLIRTTVEEHAKVYHPGKPEIHRVNLDVLLHDNVIENHLNINCTNTVTSGPFERHNHSLSIPAKTKESSDLLVQVDQLNNVKVKIEPKNLDDDPCPIEQMTFICQSDLDIKQDFENDRTEMLCDRLQLNLATEMIKESEMIQRENKEPKSTSEEMETFNDEINTPEKFAKTKKSLEVIEIGPISVVKEFNVFTFHCKIPNCNYSSDNKKAFALHCEVIHKDFFYSFDTRKCNICSIKFEYEGKFIAVYDVYLHMVTMHKDFFKPESAIKFKLMSGVSNILSQTYHNPGSEIPSIMSNVMSLTSESDPNSCNSPLPLIPHITEDKEEVLSSEVKLPVITSVESLTPKMEPLVSMSDDDSKCASVQTDILMTDTEKQNRKCPKALAIMMEPSLLNALYKCPKYNCTFATMLSLSFQKHFATHYSILKDTLVPCLYCDCKVLCSSYVIHLEVRHGHCIFGCGDCFYRTTNSYFVTMHRELVHPNTKFNILQLQGATSNRVNSDTTSPNLSELVQPYSCKEDGFLNCPFKSLYFDEYLKHVKAVHQVDGCGSFSSEYEPQKEAVIEGWLAKEVGPFQCGYCKKATVTHEEMGRHQAVFHAQEQCLFYYRKFVPNGTVLIPEHVNLEDPSFINHVIHLPNQIHLCNFKLTDGLLSSTSTKLTNGESEKDIKSELDQSSVWLDEPKAFNVVVKDEDYVLDESDLMYFEEQPRNDGAHNDAMVADCKLQCKWKDCYQIYHSQTALAKHIEMNHVELQSGKEFTCFWNNCPRKSKPYNRRSHLSSHMIAHSGEKPHKCPDCSKTFTYIRSLKIHKRSHTGERPYLCQFSNCSKSFFTISLRNYHQKMHYDPDAYACQVTGCSKKYTDRSALRKHMKNHATDEQLGAKWKPVDNKQKEDGAKHQRTHYNTLQCKWKDCYQTHHSQMALVKHVEKNHAQLQSGKEFTCFWNNCPRKLKPFNKRVYLLIHMRVHTGEKPHKCPFQGCNKAYPHSGQLNIHKKSHTGEKPYLCQFSNCLKSFSTNSIRNYHQRLHYDPEAYACQVTGCSKKYNEPSNLRQHMKSHTIEEQLEAKWKSVKKKQENDFMLKKSSNNLDGPKQQRTCDTLQCKWEGCYQTHHSQMALVKHIEKNHVRLQIDKKFTCFWSNCPRKSKPFNWRSGLLVHMKIHSGEKPHKCPFQGCNKTYSHLGHLKIHKESHTGERPYLCQFSSCLKSFSVRSIRNYHQRLHYDPHAFACQVTGCSKKYTEPSNLRKHMKIHTIEEQLEAKRKSVEQNRSSLEGAKPQRMHCDIKPDVSQVANFSKKYADPSTLWKHIENHTVIEEVQVKQNSVENEEKENDFIIHHL